MRPPHSISPPRLPLSVKAEAERRARADGIRTGQFVDTGGGAEARRVFRVPSDHATRGRRDAGT
jgi:hypothetical protein